MGRNLLIKTFYQEMEGFHIKSPSYGCTHCCKNQKLSSVCKITEDALLRINQIILWQFDMDNQFLWNSFFQNNEKLKIVINFGIKNQMLKTFKASKITKWTMFLVLKFKFTALENISLILNFEQDMDCCHSV